MNRPGLKFSAKDKKHILKTAAAVLLALALPLSLAACGAAKQDISGTLSDTGASAQGADTVSYELTLAFANNDYITEGDENLDKLFHYRYTLDMAEEDTSAAVNEALGLLSDESFVKSLADSQPGAESAVTFVGDPYRIADICIDADGVCQVDIEGSDDIYDQNMYTETFFIYQVTDTLISSFDDINSVQFLVDGEGAESLCYMDISAPFTADDVADFTGNFGEQQN